MAARLTRFTPENKSTRRGREPSYSLPPWIVNASPAMPVLVLVLVLVRWSSVTSGWALIGHKVINKSKIYRLSFKADASNSRSYNK